MMITVHTQNGTRKIPSHGTVLESLEKAGIRATNHCRDGFCGACRCKSNGKASYGAQPLAYVRKGEILPCVSIAEDNLEIEV
ncbi:2Fe-2S iron-sulfur cluster-binding protein [Aliidiomarina quisquiliarum]|uniref:2Fe-2S iron-sulfur cluster-binding protein n=1 Tax=Aliidiomarina quisquiliarum TaxID=2938947 RepID=UPI00208DF185|nr:2Fe-2S iron-sulfur cluster-binding protein [Aliidiomarina quisquiliarum]MCO4320015.1 2Fe-2S iron-sulfur cluster-binding protein [Aliidiomarina quisquiliarum]